MINAICVPGFERARDAARRADRVRARFPADSTMATVDDHGRHAVRLRAIGSSHHDWLTANARREVHQHRRRQLFAEFDAVVCPITPTPAFPHGHHPNPLERHIDIDGAEYPYFDQFVSTGLATMPRPARHRHPEPAIGGFQAPN